MCTGINEPSTNHKHVYLTGPQDAVKKITGDELPDFYNIVLERPKDDEQGYDVLFIDAASKVEHSCSTAVQRLTHVDVAPWAALAA